MRAVLVVVVFVVGCQSRPTQPAPPAVAYTPEPKGYGSTSGLLELRSNEIAIVTHARAYDGFYCPLAFKGDVEKLEGKWVWIDWMVVRPGARRTITAIVAADPPDEETKQLAVGLYHSRMVPANKK
jgi:hypothetical protein